MDATTEDRSLSELETAAAAVVEACHRFTTAMRDPRTGQLAEYRKDQQAAYDALCDAVDRLEAIRAGRS